MGDDTDPLEERKHELAERKALARRRMAWICLAFGLAVGVAVIAAALIFPEVADRADKVSMELAALFAFLGGPLVVFMGGEAAVDLRNAVKR